ncbi:MULTISPECIES: DUF6799 domain-containing protein [unclassified Olleya]|jgi:hypothetical protein|uniref:DUF6799 domain-containing protein n=1 Tax=unclassified Olleya TaxID=2615019 RepID=UPI0011A7DC67|nr:DUF6799 domain-containing protein [Olleya sp. Hel_I_94]TVZ46378.1 hypothetical protein JM82_0950 [Olleya sp. Hel_I_94]|tara:strand:+ start:28281 stop:28604 length:324 start_codon:yes stop_codon:yes gene_type:complete
MKKLILIAFTVFLGINTMMAQDAKQIEDANYVILLDSKVFHYTADGVAPLKGDLKLNNGTIVKSDGTYIVDQKTLQLKDGQCLGMSGTLYKDQETLTKKLMKQMKKS